MARTSTTTRRRRRAVALKWLRRLLVLSLAGAVLGLGATAAVLYVYGRDLPRLITLDDYHPRQATRIWADDGQVLAVLARERRSVRPLERIPEVVRNAVLAAEDAEFYRHQGLDYTAMVRAFVAVVRSGGRFTQGGSTITQQVVKTFLLTPEKTVSRKVKEVILAHRLEKNLSKDDILSLYLNQIYFGHGAYGVQEAARTYYGKDVEALGLNEAAVLAGIVQSPERLSPLKHPEAARARRAYVLDEMAKAGFVEAALAERTKTVPLGARRHREAPNRLAPHFVEHVRRRLKAMVGDELLYAGGLSVHTTLDTRLQQAANAAVTEGLRAVDLRRRFARRLRHLRSESDRARFLKTRPADPPKPGHVVQGVVVTRTQGHDGYQVALAPGVTGVLTDTSLLRYVSDKRPAHKLFQAGDVIRVSARERRGNAPLRLEPELGPSAALVALEPATRRVVALIGGDPLAPDAFNRATQAKRQPGSAFKPLVYGAALEARRIHPASIYPDSPEVYTLPDGRRWAPNNYDRTFRGPIRIRHALAHSVNMVAIKVLRDVGTEPVIELGRRLGITTRLDPYLPLALGASAVRPIELANVYAVLASGGRLADPVFIDRVEGPAGSVMFRAEGQPREVLDPAVAWLVTDLLRSVVREGTAVRARNLGHPVAGKTGTTNDHTDAWFAGYLPGLAAVTWVGFDDNRSLGKGEQGSRTALPIWLSFVREAVRDRSAGEFPRPEGIETKRIDRETGLLAPEGLPEDRVLEEHFLAGTGPTQVATLPGEVTEDSFLLDQFGLGDGSGEEPAPPAPGVPPPVPPTAAPLPAPPPSPPPPPPRPAPPVRRTLDPEDLPPR